MLGDFYAECRKSLRWTMRWGIRRCLAPRRAPLRVDQRGSIRNTGVKIQVERVSRGFFPRHRGSVQLLRLEQLQARIDRGAGAMGGDNIAVCCELVIGSDHASA